MYIAEYRLYSGFVYCSEFGSTHLQTISLAGVEDAYSSHSDAEPKGIKAHFRVDDSGLLHLDKVCKTHTTVLRLCGICPGKPG